MVSLKRKGRRRVLLKSQALILICLSFLGILSCKNGTSSTGSSSGTSGTGTGWNITIQIGTNPLHFTTGDLSGTNTTTVLSIVKDSTGAPAPLGTNICTTAVLNGFIKPGSADVFATLCETTTNNLGQSIQTYRAKLSPGVDTIEVSSQGVIARTSITVLD